MTLLDHPGTFWKPSLPVVEELTPAPEAEEVFLRLASEPYCIYFDSARRDTPLGRYSFVAADPVEMLVCGPEEADPLGRLAKALEGFETRTVDGLPPFQGGAAGLLSYDLGRSLERLPSARYDEFQTPVMAMGLYDLVVVFDHHEHRTWIISQGFPEKELSVRRRLAEKRLERLLHLMLLPAELPVRRPTGPANLTIQEFAAQHPIARWPGVTSTFTERLYMDAVARAIEYIRGGDIFQVNLAQRLLAPAADDAVDLYLRLRQRNPATFAGYFDLGPFQIASASPERFLKVHSRNVEARPIKGTRQRSARPEADLFAAEELRESEKDLAENVMIVDLLRNDIARVCRPDSVKVTQLCQLESYEFVQHLVSAVCGQLEEGRSAIDLLRAAFPGGSVTGAPKIRAMEIIAELEPTARGPYCGALGYLGFDGSLDTNILIRTITAGRGWWQAPVGGGIVAQSVPAREYEETWHKAEGLLRAFS